MLHQELWATSCTWYLIIPVHVSKILYCLDIYAYAIYNALYQKVQCISLDTTPPMYEYVLNVNSQQSWTKLKLSFEVSVSRWEWHSVYKTEIPRYIANAVFPFFHIFGKKSYKIHLFPILSFQYLKYGANT